ncbi:MAG: glycosyltransferase [Chloroflexi bacterium]|nr:glycosyltransferase [Chloroflexota bacterium]
MTYLAVDDVFHPRLGAERDEAVRAKYNLPDRFVLYLGGFDVRKQVNELLLAYTYVTRAEGDQVPLVLAGREPEGAARCSPTCANTRTTSGWTRSCSGSTRRTTRTNPACIDWRPHMSGRAARKDSGCPCSESMACGTPTIAWNAPVIQEIVGDGAYLVDSAREMAGAILAVLGETSLRNTLVNQGLAQVTRYSWRKTARETAAVYDHVLAAVRTAQKGG